METLLHPANHSTESGFWPTTVEVFKTNVASAPEGVALLRALHRCFPQLRATLDLDDCDRVLRVQSPVAEGPRWQQVVELGQCLNVKIDVLPD